MYNYLIGKIKYIKENYIVLDNQGIGYKIFVANPFKYKLENEYKVYIYNHITDNDNLLYGFFDDEELALFNKLISVKGVGPKTALPFLATGSPGGIADAINRENILYLTKFPKIGEKTAKQIILDLKGKISFEGEMEINQTEELVDALVSLGYKQTEIKKVLTNIDSNIKLEDQIKEALKLLMR